MRTQLIIVFFTLGVFSAQAQDQQAKLVIPVGHTSGITAVDISPNGRYMLTASLDRTAKIWDKSGYEIQTLEGHKRNVLAAVFSPKCPDDPDGGRFILTGSSDQTAILWDKFGRLVKTIKDHQGNVTAVAFSPDGTEMLTGSKDKTALLFDLSGKVIQKFTHNSEVNAVAFSPQGDKILTACKDNNVLLWSHSGGSLQHSFLGHKAAVLCVAFSQSGDTILTGSADGTAILWKLNGVKIREFKHAKEVQAVAITYVNGLMKIVSASSDGSLKIWNLTDETTTSFKLYDRDARTLKASADGQYVLSGSGANNAAKMIDIKGRLRLELTGYTSTITALTISPDEASLLVGHADSTAKLWDLASLKVQNFPFPGKLESVDFSPATPTLGGKFILVGCEDHFSRILDSKGNVVDAFPSADRAVFSPDGKYVLTGNSDGTTKLWNIANKTSVALQHKESRITALAFSPVAGAQQFAVGSYDGAVIVWDSAGAPARHFKIVSLAPVRSLSFSRDGKSLAFGSEGGLTKVRDLSGNLLHEFPNRQRGIQNIRSLAFSPADLDGLNEGKYVIRSSGSNAERWDLETGTITTYTGHTSEISAVAYAQKGKTIFTGSKDGTIKIWNAASGKEVATMVAIGAADWAVTSPSGLFDASPGAMKLLHFTAGLEVIGFDQLKVRYYEPGLLQKLLGFIKYDVRNVSDIGVLELYPEIDAKIDGDSLRIKLSIRSGGLGKLSLFINGKEVSESINDNCDTQLSVGLIQYAKYYEPGVNTLALRVFNNAGWLKSKAYELSYFPADMPVSGRGVSSNNNNESPSLGNAKPHLYAIVVGTSDYSGDQLDLRFPDLDAAAMAVAFQNAGTALFEDRVHLTLLTSTGTAEKSSSKTAIAAAFKACSEQAKAIDILIVYFAGHGLTYGSAEQSQFYYLTKDIGSPDLNDPSVRDQYTVSSEDLTHWLTAIPARKQVMIFDACNSGKVVEALASIGGRELNASQIRAFDRMKDRTGMFILTGAAADKVSYEASQYGQGLLTYSLLQGMSGMALGPGKLVDVMTLFQFARNEVPVLAKGIKQIQVPVLAFPDGGGSFDIGYVDENVKIPLAQVKPVFIRNNFQDKDNYRDVLGLTDALANQFQLITARGANAHIIYVDVEQYENAYSIKGRYSITDNTVSVVGSLFKGNVDKGKFEVSGTKDDVPGLVNSILEKVMGML